MIIKPKKYIKKILSYNRRNIQLIHQDNAQIMVLTGFLVLVTVVVLAVISANLVSIGTDVPSRHSKALLPDFLSVSTKFGLGLQENALRNTDFLQDFDVNQTFNQTLNYFYLLNILNGKYFHAELINCSYSGYFYMYDPIDTSYTTGSVCLVKVSLTLDDGSSRVSQDLNYQINVIDYLRL